MTGEEERPNLLKGVKDRFGGLTIRTTKVNHQSDEEFEDRLKGIFGPCPMQN
jgi:hypothetical protein